MKASLALSLIREGEEVVFKEIFGTLDRNNPATYATFDESNEIVN